MDLTFSQVEAVFAKRFDIEEARMVAFRGRLQHLQRLKFPSEVNTGRGKKASYGWLQIIELMVALDLIDLGWTPDTVAKLVKANRGKLMTAVQQILSGFADPYELEKAIKKRRCPYLKTQFVLTSAVALTVGQAADGGKHFLQMLWASEFRDWVEDRSGGDPIVAQMDFGSRLFLIANWIGQIARLSPSEIVASLTGWNVVLWEEDMAP